MLAVLRAWSDWLSCYGVCEYERLRQRRYRAVASEEAKNKRRTADVDRKRRRLQEEPDDKT